MAEDFDIGRLAEIPDPFAGEAARPAGPRAAPASKPPSPTRSRVHATRTLAAVCAVAFEVAWLLHCGFRPDLHSTPAWLIAVGFLLPIASAAIAFAAVTRRGAYGLGEPAARMVALVLAPPALFALVTMLVSPSASDGAHAVFWHGAVGCATVTAVLTAGPLVLGMLAFRHAFVASSRWRTGALGVACGALAAATMDFTCPDQTALHIVVGHGTAMVVGGLAGAFLGSRITRA